MALKSKLKKKMKHNGEGMGGMNQMATPKQMHYPSMLDLDEGDYPDVKNWQTGKQYKVELVVKQVQSAMGEGGGMMPNDTDKKEMHCKFEVVKVLEGEEYTGKEKEEKEPEENQEE